MFSSCAVVFIESYKIATKFIHKGLEDKFLANRYNFESSLKDPKTINSKLALIVLMGLWVEVFEHDYTSCLQGILEAYLAPSPSTLGRKLWGVSSTSAKVQ